MNTSELRLDVDAAVDLQALLEHLDRFRRMALEVQFFGDRDVLAHRFRRRAFLRVDVGEAGPRLEIRGIDLDHLPQGFRRFLQPVPLELIFRDDLILALRLHDEALFRVEVRELGVGLDHGGVELVDLLPDRDRLEVESVARVEVGDLGVLVARLAHLPDLREEVADLVDRVPVARIVLEQLTIERDRLIELPCLLGLLGLLAGLNRIDLCQGILLWSSWFFRLEEC